MKTRIYIKVGRGRNSSKAKVAAHVRPSYTPLYERRNGLEHEIPTAMFALDLDVPEEALKRAEQVAATVALDAAAAEVLVSAPAAKDGPGV